MPGLLRGVARTAVVAGTASSVAGRVHRRQEKKWARKDAADAQAYQNQYGEQQPAYAQPQQQQQAPQTQYQPANADDQLEQLERLGELKDKGVLTEAVFQQKKAEILRG